MFALIKCLLITTSFTTNILYIWREVEREREREEEEEEEEEESEEEMEEGQVLTEKMIVSVVLGGVVGLFIYLYNTLILKPKRLQLRLGKQGIRGPSPSFLVGNIPQIKRIQTQKAHSTTPKHVPIAHDWYCTLFPYIEQWRNQYGNLSSLSFVVFFGLSYALGFDF